MSKVAWKKQILFLKMKLTDLLMEMNTLNYLLCDSNMGDNEVEKICKTEQLANMTHETQKIRNEIKRIKEQNTSNELPTQQKSKELERLNECSKELKYIPIRELETILHDVRTNEHQEVMNYVNRYSENQTDESPREFIMRLREKMVIEHASIIKELEISDIFQIDLCIENYVFPFIHNKIMDDLHLQSQDIQLYEQCKLFSQSTQEDFNINPKLIDNSYVPYFSAISLFRTVNFSLTPSRKLYTIIQAAKEVFNITARLLPGESIGGDDFTDIWVYVVTKAKIENLWSVISFINEYGNEELLQAELGYYFTTTHLAASYISKLQPNKLQASKKCVIASGPFLVFEKEKYKRFCETFGHIQIIRENLELVGYKLYAHLDLIKRPGRFFCTFLCQTNKATDKVVAHVLQAQASINSIQLEFLYSTFFCDNSTYLLQSSNSEFGVFFKSTKINDQLHFHVKSGDFDNELSIIKAVIGFTCLGYDVIHNNLPYLKYEDLEEFYNNYQIDLSTNVTNAIINIIKRVQKALILLGFFPRLCEVDGLFSYVLQDGITQFKEFFNSYIFVNLNVSESRSFNISKCLLSKSKVTNTILEINERFILSPESYFAILNLLDDYRSGLAELGYSLNGDISTDHFEEFSELISKFQKSIEMIPNYVFDKKTISALISKLETHSDRTRAFNIDPFFDS